MLSHSKQAYLLIRVKISKRQLRNKGLNCATAGLAFGETLEKPRTLPSTCTMYRHSAPREEHSFKDRADLFGWASFQ